MIRLSPKEVDLVQDAIIQFGTAADNRAWSDWLRDNPMLPSERRHSALPLDLAKIVLGALRSHVRWTGAEIRSGRHDEDVTAELDNDLTVTEAVLSDISRDLGLGASPR